MLSLGEDVPFELVAPVIQHCSGDALLRFEQASPVSVSDLPVKPGLIQEIIPLQSLAKDTSGAFSSVPYVLFVTIPVQIYGKRYAIVPFLCRLSGVIQIPSQSRGETSSL